MGTACGDRGSGRAREVSGGHARHHRGRPMGFIVTGVVGKRGMPVVTEAGL